MKIAFLRSGVAVCLAVAAVVGASGSAFAGLTVYNDRAAFEAAVSGTITNENFNSVVADQSFQTADGSKTVGALTFAETGPSTAGTVNGKPNQIDASPFEISGIFSGDKTTYVYLAANADDNAAGVYGVDLTFSGAVTAFGGDFTEFVGISASEAFRLTLLSSTTAGSFLLPTPAQTDTFFFGIIADGGDSFGGIGFSADVVVPSRRAVAGLDNVAIVFEDEPSGPAIPEPASALVIGLGMAGGILARRRRRG